MRHGWRMLLGVMMAITLPTIALALARGFQVTDMRMRSLHATPLVAVLDRDGGDVFAGRDNPRRLRSGVIARNGLDWVTVPGFAGDDAEWHELVACVQDQFDGLAIEIRDSPPSRGDYIRVMIGGGPDMFGFDETVHGIAPWSGRVIANTVVFAFQTPDVELTRLCEVAAHEIGHTLGLDHSRDCADTMSYESCGPKRFRDDAAPCGEWEDRSCGSGRENQSSSAELARRVGRTDQVFTKGPLSFRFVDAL